MRRIDWAFYQTTLLWVLVAALMLLASGCRERQPQLRPLSAAATVLAFGDSLTYGTGAAREESYPVWLAALLQRPVINAGVPGEVTAEGVARLPEVLDRHSPDLLILCHGGNDLLRRTGEEQAAENLRVMIRLAQERGVDVVLIGVPKPDLSFEPPPFYARIAGEFAVPYDNSTLATILSDRNRKSDYIHPNALGYRHLAEAVYSLLQAANAL